MSAKAVLRISKRTGRAISQGFAGKNRYRTPSEIKSIADLRTFFYEYSLFVGDFNALPGIGTFKFANSSRAAFLKAGRVLGDAKAISNSFKSVLGDATNESTRLGERYFRRFGGRMTGKVLMAIPGQNFVARGTRSIVGANMQKEFNDLTNKLFGKKKPGSKPAATAKGYLDTQALFDSPQITKLLEAVAEGTARNAYDYTPVKTGKLRGSIRPGRNDIKIKGGDMQGTKVEMGGEGIDYAHKIEYGSGDGFEQGTPAAVKELMPAGSEVQYLRAGEYRRAVNPNTGKGAMLRRGAYKEIEKIKRMGVKVRRRESWQEIIRDAKNVKKI